MGRTKRIVTVIAAALALTGCAKHESATEKPQPVAQAESTSAALDTAAIAAPDTAPRPPAGYKSIHQIELEEHKKQEK